MLSEIFSCTLSSLSSFILCLFASVLNTNCDVGRGFDDFKIERLVCAFECLPWLVFYPDLLWTHSYIYLHSALHWQVDKWLSFCGTTADTSIKFCSATFWWLLVDGLPFKKNRFMAVFLESNNNKKVEPVLHQKTAFYKLLLDMWMWRTSGWNRSWSGRVTEITIVWGCSLCSYVWWDWALT